VDRTSERPILPGDTRLCQYRHLEIRLVRNPSRLEDRSSLAHSDVCGMTIVL